MSVLGIDTSNYTTSAAVFDGHQGLNKSIVLPVRPGELGLRQSDALFLHIRQLPEVFKELQSTNLLQNIEAIGASTRPRAVDGSYMPCFLAGVSQGKVLANVLRVPFWGLSHQQGHLAAAAWSANRMDLLDAPFLAWHLSGGTTELLLVEPDGYSVNAVAVGGTSDISAGQLIDRTGVRLGLHFPAGKALDELSGQSDDSVSAYRVKLDGLQFSLSGMENKMNAMVDAGTPPADVAHFVLDTICKIVIRTTLEAQHRWPGFPVLCSGGVASNRRLRILMEQNCSAIFAKPQYSTDNAMGIAILTWRGQHREEERH